MPITLSMHKRMGYHVVRFHGDVVFAELADLARLHDANRAFAAADAIHIIEPDADLSRVQLEHIDMLRAHYAHVQRHMDLYLVRRSAWVCVTVTTCQLVEYWLAGRHSRDGQGTEFILSADLAGVFPLFSQDEIAAVELGGEFVELTRIGGDAQRRFSASA